MTFSLELHGVRVICHRSSQVLLGSGTHAELTGCSRSVCQGAAWYKPLGRYSDCRSLLPETKSATSSLLEQPPKLRPSNTSPGCPTVVGTAPQSLHASTLRSHSNRPAGKPSQAGESITVSWTCEAGPVHELLLPQREFHWVIVLESVGQLLDPGR